MSSNPKTATMRSNIQGFVDSNSNSLENALDIANSTSIISDINVPRISLPAKFQGK